jgi:ParB/RepB/Spo0J family partition protein
MPHPLTVPPESLELDPAQVARHEGTDSLRLLTESVALHGILQPVGVVPGVSKSLRVVFGNGRVLAALAAKLKEVPIVVLDPKTLKGGTAVLTMVENLVRSDFTVSQVVDGVEELKRLHPEWSNQVVASHISVDPSMVTRWVAIGKCPIARGALADGRLKGVSDAHTIAVAPPEQKESLLALKLSGATRDELARVARKGRIKDAPESAVKTAKIKAVLPSGYTVTVSGPGVSLEDAAEALADTIKELKRARELGYTAKTFAAALADKARKA